MVAYNFLQDMALATSMRVFDKEHQWFDQYDDLFDKFVDSDPFDFNDTSADYTGSDAFGSFFDLTESLSTTDNTRT